jgi:hypothetical protein
MLIPLRDRHEGTIQESLNPLALPILACYNASNNSPSCISVISQFSQLLYYILPVIYPEGLVNQRLSNNLNVYTKNKEKNPYESS